MWFKNQQKRAGKTAEDIASIVGKHHSGVSRIYNGRQPMTLEWGQAFAQALNLPLDEILKKAGTLDEQRAQSFAPGFSESDAVQWTGSPGEKIRTNDIAHHFGGGLPGVDVWTVRSGAMMSQGLLIGDQILVDTNSPSSVKAGDVVLAQRYDNTTGTAVTMLRRFEPPVLIAVSAEPDQRMIHVVDNENVVIVGKVIASWRGKSGSTPKQLESPRPNPTGPRY